MANSDAPPRAVRRQVTMKVDFIVDADIIPAESVNLSESGIAFRTSEPIRVWMRLGEDQDVIPRDQPAELVWAQKDPEGGTTYGLQFVDPQDEGDL
jgi:hypothetical protein